MNQIKTVRKIFLAWEFDKEERWLNLMAMQGWKLVSVGFFRYTFRSCEAGEYTVRLAMNGRDEGYISFMEEMGAEYIGGIMQWGYFCKKSAEGEFKIFSDIDSKIAHIDRISKILAAVGFANLAIGLANSFSALHIGWINLLCATFIMYGLGRLHGKKEALEGERQLVE